jgi:cell wall-associated NlpC family hydrolase
MNTEPVIPQDYIVNAVNWAKSRLGNTNHRGKCLAFVEDAYEQSNNVEIFGGDTAQESAEQYQADNPNTLPPIGAFVFYACEGPIEGVHYNWGHVGLYIGEGGVIHAWDQIRLDSLADMPNLVPPPGWTRLYYIGWAPVEVIFRGFRKL